MIQQTTILTCRILHLHLSKLLELMFMNFLLITPIILMIINFFFEQFLNFHFLPKFLQEISAKFLLTFFELTIKLCYTINRRLECDF